jgi:hypothetical protein
MTFQRSARSLATTLLIIGCWHGGSGEISSLDGKQVIGDAPEDRFETLCAEVDRWSVGAFGSDEFKRWQCEIDAALNIRLNRSGLVSDYIPECKHDAMTCYEARRMLTNLVPRCHRGPDRCTATVNDLEQCLTDLHYNLYGALWTAPMCDDICRTFDPSTLDAASCRAFRSACPGYMFTGPPEFPLLEEGVPDNCQALDGGSR